MTTQEISKHFVALVQGAQPQLVRVGPARGHARGISGLVVGDGDHVVTSSRALQGDDDLRVGMADTEVEAELVGRDPALDLAVVRFDPDGLPQAPVAAQWRDDVPRVGELVLVLARPGKTVRAALALIGVVGDGMRMPSGARIDHWVELDRPLPRGFASAAILDAEGRIAGIASRGVVRGTAIVLEHGVVQRSLDELRKHGTVRRGYLGVGVYPARLTDDLVRAHGQHRAVTVVGLEDGGPAASAGILVGDLVLAVEGDAVDSPLSLRAALLDRAGESVQLRLLRAGQARDLTLTVGARP